MKNKLTAAILLCLCITAHAEFLTGNKLLQYMQGTEQEQAFALGYVAGSFDVGSGTNHCPPANITIKQVSDMTKLLLDRVPQHREKSADSFVSAILKTTWPCKQQQSGKQV